MITTERGEALAAEFGLKFFETSAKSGSNINEMFFEVADQIVKDRPVQAQSSKATHGYAAYQTQQVSGEQARVKLG